MTSKKYFSDTAWNFGAFGVQALAGALLNLVLMKYAGPGALGIFNQLYAVFVVAGQLAVLGLNDSCQKHVAQFDSNKIEKSPLIAAALNCAFFAGLGGSIVLLLLSFGIAKTSMDSLSLGVRYLAPGVLFFVLNKVLLAILNGEQRMRFYALGQSTRAILVVAGCLAVGLSDLPKSLMGAAFTLSEFFLFLIIVPPLRSHHARTRKSAHVWRWMRQHFHFGLRALPHGFLTEAMIRIDILMLSFFVNETQIGIYSFVAFFVEGVLQVPLVVRTVTNPIWTGVLLRRKAQEFFKVALRSILTSGLSTLAVIAIVFALFPTLISYFPKTEPIISLRLLGILMTGLGIYSFFLPLDNMLLQGGHPALQSLYMIIAAGINVILNWYLIPTLQLEGAAIATAISFAVSGPIFCLIAYFALDFKFLRHERC